MDLISREDVIKLIHKKIETTPHFIQHEVLIDLEFDIEDQPTIDAVPVVRCKDCKHYHKDEGWCDKHSHFINSDGSACHPWEGNDWKMFMEDDFCSGGERKDGAE